MSIQNAMQIRGYLAIAAMASAIMLIPVETNGQISHLNLSKALKMTTARNVDWLDNIRFTEDLTTRKTRELRPQRAKSQTALPQQPSFDPSVLQASYQEAATSDIQSESCSKGCPACRRVASTTANAAYPMPVEMSFVDESRMPVIRSNTDSSWEAGCSACPHGSPTLPSLPLANSSNSLPKVSQDGSDDLDIPAAARFLQISLMGVNDADQARSLIVRTLNYVSQRAMKTCARTCKGGNAPVDRELHLLRRENQELRDQLASQWAIAHQLESMQRNIERNHRQLCLMSTETAAIERRLGTPQRSWNADPISPLPNVLLPIVPDLPETTSDREILELRAQLKQLETRLDALSNRQNIQPAGLLEPIPNQRPARFRR